MHARTRLPRSQVKTWGATVMYIVPKNESNTNSPFMTIDSRVQKMIGHPSFGGNDAARIMRALSYEHSMLKE